MFLVVVRVLFISRPNITARTSSRWTLSFRLNSNPRAGAVVASNLLQGNNERPDYRGTSSVVSTLPHLAGVGLTEKAARARGLNVRVKTGDTTSWFSNRRLREAVGMFKTIIGADSDQVLGAHLPSAHADEVINLFALAVRFGISATDLKHMIYAYPTSGIQRSETSALLS